MFLFFNTTKITWCFSRVFITGCLSAAFFCFLPACQKMSSQGQRAWKWSKKKAAKWRLVTSVLLNQTKPAKLNRCTPLDRVMFHVCALLIKIGELCDMLSAGVMITGFQACCLLWDFLCVGVWYYRLCSRPIASAVHKHKSMCLSGVSVLI